MPCCAWLEQVLFVGVLYSLADAPMVQPAASVRSTCACNPKFMATFAVKLGVFLLTLALEQLTDEQRFP